MLIDILITSKLAAYSNMTSKDKQAWTCVVTNYAYITDFILYKCTAWNGNKPVECKLPAEFYYHTYMYQNNLDWLEFEPGQSGLLQLKQE